MREQYTEQARSALQCARKASHDCQQNYIGTEHLLLGLLIEKEGTAGRVLADMGVEEKNLRGYIERFISTPGNVMLDSSVEYSKRAEQVLEGAGREAASFQADKTGTEHILIAMIKETECVATRLLHTMGISIQKLYMEILIAMGENPAQIKEEIANAKSSRENQTAATPTLDQYSRDLTEMARRRE